jgi:UDP-glucose 4-epimerase
LGIGGSKRLAGLRIAVTGGGGFIGEHVLRHFLAAGAELLVLGPTPHKRPLVRSLVANKEVRYLPDGLVADPADLADALHDYDSLVHLHYTRPSLGGFWTRLAAEVDANLLLTLRLLDAAERARVGQVCFASSVQVYTPPARGVSEYGPVGGPVSPYALVKLEQESAFRTWEQRTGRPAAMLRLSTVYGPGETVDRAIPNFIRAALGGTQPVVSGYGAGLFDPVYVGDVAEAFSMAIGNRAGGTFNIGTGRGRSSREVAALVIRLCQADCDIAEDLAEPDRGGPVCDVSRADEILGFRATTPLEVGLQHEIDWLRDPALTRTA